MLEEDDSLHGSRKDVSYVDLRMVPLSLRWTFTREIQMLSVAGRINMVNLCPRAPGNLQTPQVLKRSPLVPLRFAFAAFALNPGGCEL